MFEHIFEGRDRKLATLVGLGDTLARSLRENVLLFSVDGEDDIASYLTESNKVITGVLVEKGNDSYLAEIRVDDASVFDDPTKTDGLVRKKITEFLGGLHSDDIPNAHDAFRSVLKVMENRVKFGYVQKRLQARAYQLESVEKIFGTDQFNRLEEARDGLVKWLKENKDDITSESVVRNGVRLSDLVSRAFNMPKKSYDELVESKECHPATSVSRPIYEMVCRQELIKTELLESRRDFNLIWASNEKIRNLASKMNADADDIKTALAEAIMEVPYLALASKKNMSEVFARALAVNENTVGITEKDVQSYSSKIFELKKPVKEQMLSLLNTKYGINVQSLREPPTFRSLINTQIVVLEALSRMSPRASTQKSVLAEAAKTLKGKSGVQSIDVSNWLHGLFTDAGFTQLLGEGQLQSYLDFSKIAMDLSQIGDVLNMIMQGGDPALTGGDPAGGQQVPAGAPGGPGPGLGAGLPPDPAQQRAGISPDEEDAGMTPPMDPTQGAEAGAPAMVPGQGGPAGLPAPGQPGAQGLPTDPAVDGDFVPGEEQPGNDMGQPAMGAADVGVPPTEDEEAMMAGNEDPMPGSPDQQGGDLMGSLQDLQGLIQDLAAEIGAGDGSEVESGLGDQMPNMGGEEEMDPEMGMEGEEEMGQEFGEETPGEEDPSGEMEAPEFGGEEEDSDGETEELEDDDPSEPGKQKKFKLKGKDKNLDVVRK